MRGRSCTQPFLVEGGTCRPDAFLLLPRWATRSPPHPPQCAHWGTFPPRGRLWGDEPDLETFFHKNAFQHIFPRKMRPKSVLAYRRQQPFDRTKANQPQTQRVGTSGHKNRGSRGLAPGPLSPHFSGEMGTPAGQAGQRGAAPQGCFRGTHPKGTYRITPTANAVGAFRRGLARQ